MYAASPFGPNLCVAPPIQFSVKVAEHEPQPEAEGIGRVWDWPTETTNILRRQFDMGPIRAPNCSSAHGGS